MVSARMKSSGVVSLKLSVSPSNVDTGWPAHSISAASSVKSARPACSRLAMRGEQRRKREGLRGLHDAQSVAVGGPDDAAVVRYGLHGVGETQRRNSGPGGLRGFDRPCDQGR